MTHKRKAVFLDRDGVINQTVTRNGIDSSPRILEELKLYPRVNDALDKLRENQFELIVVTNQPDISRGFMSKTELISINNKISDLTGIIHFYVCQHDNFENCNCRKPKPGLIENAAKELNIDVKNSFMIGDRLTDIECAARAGCQKSVLISKSMQVSNEYNKFMIAKDIFEAVNLIVG